MPKPKAANVAAKPIEAPVVETKEAKDPITTDVEMNEIFDEPSLDQMIEDSPIVGVTKKEEPVETETETEDTETEESTTEKIEVKPEESATEHDEPQKVILNGQEYNQEFLAEAIKEFANKTNWEKSLRQKQQISNLTEEQIQHLVPYATGQKEIPDNTDQAANELIKQIFDPTKPIKTKDSDGYEIEIPGEEIVPYIESAVKAALKHYAPVLEKAQDVVKTSRDEVASQAMQNFMKDHPEYNINLPKGSSMRNYITDIEATGQVHPDHAKLSKFRVLMRTMQEERLDNFDDAHTFIYGDHESRVKSAENEAITAKDTEDKIKKKQERITSEAPGPQPVKSDDIDDLLDALDDPTNRVLKEIGAI